MKELTLITGSTLGGAEYVGDHLAELLEQEGYNVNVINEGELADVTNATHLLLVTSTHGAGDYPDNLAPMMALLKDSKPDLNALKYAIVAIGDSSYDTFCGAGKAASALFKSLGARESAPMLEIDILDQPLPEEPAEKWLSQHKLAICE